MQPRYLLEEEWGCRSGEDVGATGIAGFTTVQLRRFCRSCQSMPRGLCLLLRRHQGPCLLECSIQTMSNSMSVTDEGLGLFVWRCVHPSTSRRQGPASHVSTRACLTWGSHDALLVIRADLGQARRPCIVRDLCRGFFRSCLFPSFLRLSRRI